MSKAPVKKGVTMRAGNKGLTVAINFFSINKYLDEFNSQAARLWFRGKATHVDTKKVLTFNDAGQLISILGKWNAAKFRELNAAAKKKRRHDMDEQLVKVITGFGVFWLLITVIAYFWMQTRLKAAVKFEYDQKVKLIDHGYNEQLAKFKNDLEHESELSVVKLTKELELRASERNIKLTKVFEEQAKIITGTYSRLLALLNAAEDYTTLMQSNAEIQANMQDVKVASDAFYDFYHPNKIYLPKSTTNQIEQLFKSITTLVRKHVTAETINQSDLGNPLRQEQIARLNGDIDSLKDKIPALLLELEKDFHKIFGISVEERKSEI